MVWQDHDPDGVATAQWEKASAADVEDNFVDMLGDVATVYSEHYDISQIEAAFRTAAETVDWVRKDGNFGSSSNEGYIEMADRYIEVVLFSRSIIAVVRYVVDNWGRCDEADDASKLLLESAIGVGILQSSPAIDGPVDRAIEFEREMSDQSLPEARAGEKWTAVFDAERGAFRMVVLREIAALWSERLDEPPADSIQAVARTYAEAHDTIKAFKEARRIVYIPDGREYRPEEIWRDGMTGEEWFSRLAADWYDQYLHNVYDAVRSDGDRH